MRIYLPLPTSKLTNTLRTLVLTCLLTLCATALHAQEPYAVLSNDNTVLTFR